MHWSADGPRDNPELALFLALAIGFALGKVILAGWGTAIVLLVGG